MKRTKKISPRLYRWETHIKRLEYRLNELKNIMLGVRCSIAIAKSQVKEIKKKEKHE